MSFFLSDKLFNSEIQTRDVISTIKVRLVIDIREGVDIRGEGNAWL